jgi:aminoglycoside phosphotransferase (APT) family kinase protein
MGKSPLILAALAKDAASSLNFVSVRKYESLDSEDFDGALLTGDDGKHYVVRIAKNAMADANQEVELRSLKALAKTNPLPFEVTGLVAASTTRDGEVVRILRYVYGQEFDLSETSATSPLVASTGEALAAIHSLPLAVVQDNLFPEYSTGDILKANAAELDRAMETGKIPSVLLNRWEEALGNENLFRFMPTVIHGLMHPSAVLAQDEKVSGILDWKGLQIADPARDLAWISAKASEEVFYNLLIAYQQARPSADSNLRQRAQLYNELEWASWLVSGVNSNNHTVIDEALSELEIIAATVEAGTALRLVPTSFAAANIGSVDEPVVDYSEPAATFAFADAVVVSESFELVEETIDAEISFEDTETAPIEIIEKPEIPMPDFLLSDDEKPAKDELF